MQGGILTKKLISQELPTKTNGGREGQMEHEGRSRKAAGVPAEVTTRLLDDVEQNSFGSTDNGDAGVSRPTFLRIPSGDGSSKTNGSSQSLLGDQVLPPQLSPETSLILMHTPRGQIEAGHGRQTIERTCSHETGCDCYTARGERLCRQGKKEFRSKKRPLANLTGGIATFYQRQNDLIDFILTQHSPDEVSGASDNEEEEERPLEKLVLNATEKTRAASLALRVSFLANLVLVVVNGVNMWCSMSMAVLASLLDSVLDLVSGFILYVVDFLKERQDLRGEYPVGKSRLEPVGVIIFAMIMGSAALQVFVSSARRLTTGFQGDVVFVAFSFKVKVMTACIIATKLLLFVYCRKVGRLTGSSSVQAFAQDHWNDVLMNVVGACGLVVSGTVPALWYVDPIGGIAIACYIIIIWGRTAVSETHTIVGRTADAHFLQQITYMVISHDDRIQYVDTVRAYHFGPMFLVEVDIVLPEGMPLREAHDIGESLQFRIEKLEAVERAFVHLDWEFTHRPEHGGEK